MNPGRILGALIAAAIVLPPLVASAADEARKTEAKAGQPNRPLTAGTVKKVDKGAGKLTISHEAIENLGMPQMTMAFRVKDPAMLDRLKAGDRINFVAEKVDGAYTVMRVEAAR